MFTGIDYTGHFFIKYGTEVVKMYLVLFTCLNIRAIHLELVPNMTTAEFINAFIRFTNIYNLPDTIYTDNANYFIQGLTVISKGQVTNDFCGYLDKNNVKHIRIPLYAAFMGAAWERMIRTVKSCLLKVIGRKQVEYFEFLTLISEITNSINTRPITYQDNDDNLTFITPNNFLKFNFGRSMVLSGVVDCGKFQTSRTELVKSLNRREKIAEDFKDRWYSEYLIGLREASRDLYDADWQDRVKIGDIVLLASLNKPRVLWQMGRVSKVIHGSDGKIRNVNVIKSDRSEVAYPLNLIYPLELSVDFEEKSAAPTEVESTTRPKRKAA